MTAQTDFSRRPRSVPRGLRSAAKHTGYDALERNWPGPAVPTKTPTGCCADT